MDHETNINELKEKIKTFCTERDWDQYHGAKDLAIGVITEASELLEHFRFKSEEEAQEMLKDPKKRKEISEELADTLYFILRFSQKYDIDLSTEFHKKMAKNAEHYPVHKVKGKNKKYNEY